MKKFLILVQLLGIYNFLHCNGSPYEAFNRAILYTRPAEIIFLIQSGEVSATTCNPFGRTIFHQLALSSNMFDEKQAKELIALGINLNKQDNDGKTALYYAVTQGKVNVLSWLLTNGANPNISSNDGQTPLTGLAQLAVEMNPAAPSAEWFENVKTREVLELLLLDSRVDQKIKNRAGKNWEDVLATKPGLAAAVCPFRDEFKN